MNGPAATNSTAGSPLSSAATDALGKAAKSSKENGKIDKSARDFEAILLGSWLQSAEETFAKVPGLDSEEEEDSGGVQFMQIAMQSLGTSLAGSGGIGIAKLIARQLHHISADSPPEGGSVGS